MGTCTWTYLCKSILQTTVFRSSGHIVKWDETPIRPTYLCSSPCHWKAYCNSCNEATLELPSTFQNMYAADVKMDSLHVQLLMLRDVVRTANKEYQLGIHKVTSVNTVREILNACKFQRPCSVKWIDCYVSNYSTNFCNCTTFSTLQRLMYILQWNRNVWITLSSCIHIISVLTT